MSLIGAVSKMNKLLEFLVVLWWNISMFFHWILPVAKTEIS